MASGHVYLLYNSHLVPCLYQVTLPSTTTTSESFIFSHGEPAPFSNATACHIQSINPSPVQDRAAHGGFGLNDIDFPDTGPLVSLLYFHFPMIRGGKRRETPNISDCVTQPQREDGRLRDLAFTCLPSPVFFLGYTPGRNQVQGLFHTSPQGQHVT